MRTEVRGFERKLMFDDIEKSIIGEIPSFLTAENVSKKGFGNNAVAFIQLIVFWSDFHATH